MSHHFRLVGDFGGVWVIIGTLAGWLPPIAALCAIIWYLVLFYDRFVLKRLNKD